MQELHFAGMGAYDQLGKVNIKVGLKKIVEGAYLLPLGMANAVLLDSGHELAFVDAGFPDTAIFVFLEVDFS